MTVTHSRLNEDGSKWDALAPAEDGARGEPGQAPTASIIQRALELAGQTLHPGGPVHDAKYTNFARNQLPEFARALQKHSPLIAAVQEWAGDSEGYPQTPSDARLLKALWTHEGDQTKPCPECDGDCGEPCAPCTVEAAHAMLDAWIEQYNLSHGIRQLLPEPKAKGA